jgi:GxxExxY protein
MPGKLSRKYFIKSCRNQLDKKSRFLVEGKVLVELKAIIELEDVHLAQALNYLKAYRLEVGLLINFGSKSLTFKRLVL